MTRDRVDRHCGWTALSAIAGPIVVAVRDGHRSSRRTPLLQVFDMATSLAFSRDVLDFDVADESGEDWALLRLRGVELMLNTAYESHARPAASDSARIAM